MCNAPFASCHARWDLAVSGRACLVKTSEVIMNAIRVADRSRVERSGLAHGLWLKVGIVTAKRTHKHLPRLRVHARALLAKKERRLQAKLAVEKVSRVVTALYMRKSTRAAMTLWAKFRSHVARGEVEFV